MADLPEVPLQRGLLSQSIVLRLEIDRVGLYGPPPYKIYMKKSFFENFGHSIIIRLLKLQNTTYMI